LETDHIIPQCKSGKDQGTTTNKAVACHGCNRDKGSYDPRNGETLDGEAIKEPIDEAMRSELIRRAWQRIRENRERKQYPAAHRDMIDEIKNRKDRGL
jgi:hypothetical protein